MPAASLAATTRSSRRGRGRFRRRGWPAWCRGCGPRARHAGGQGRRSRPWTATTGRCRCRPGAPNATPSTTSATAPCACLPRSTAPPARCWARPTSSSSPSPSARQSPSVGPRRPGSSRTRSEFDARPAAPPFAGEAKADLVASFSRRSQYFTRLQPGSPARTMVNRCFWRVIVCDGVWVLIEFQKKTELPPDRSDGLDRAIVGVTYFRRDGYMIETTGIRHRITLTCDKPFDPNKEGVV